MADPASTPGAAEYLRAALPGAFRTSVAVMSLGAAVLALVLVGLAVGLNLDMKGQALLGAAGLVVWGQGAVWLVTGELQRLDSGLADLAGASWGIFLAVWWLPLTAGWMVAGAVL